MLLTKNNSKPQSCISWNKDLKAWWKPLNPFQTTQTSVFVATPDIFPGCWKLLFFRVDDGILAFGWCPIMGLPHILGCNHFDNVNGNVSLSVIYKTYHENKLPGIVNYKSLLNSGLFRKNMKFMVLGLLGYMHAHVVDWEHVAMTVGTRATTIDAVLWRYPPLHLPNDTLELNDVNPLVNKHSYDKSAILVVSTTKHVYFPLLCQLTVV